MNYENHPLVVVNYENVNEIPEMTNSDITLGSAYIRGLMPVEPPMVDAKWHDLFNHVFYIGRSEGQKFLAQGGMIEYDMKDGLTQEDGNRYYRFITSIMESYGPKHQHKEAACAYLFSVWLKDWKVSID